MCFYKIRDGTAYLIHFPRISDDCKWCTEIRLKGGVKKHRVCVVNSYVKHVAIAVQRYDCFGPWPVCPAHIVAAYP